MGNQSPHREDQYLEAEEPQEHKKKKKSDFDKFAEKRYRRYAKAYHLDDQPANQKPLLTPKQQAQHGKELFKQAYSE